MLIRIFILALAVLTAAFGDTITLKSGKTVSGSYLGGDARQIKMVVGDRVEMFSIADVERIEFGSVSAMSAPAPQAIPAPAASAAPATAPEPSRETLHAATSTAPVKTIPAQTPSANSGEIPAGTTISVRLIDPVDSQKDSVGQTYRASLDEPVMVNGEVVIPAGADVSAKLVDDKESGKLQGRTVLTLDLQSITVNGRTIPIATEEVEQASESRTKRTGVVVGGLTALGAIIGGIAGGGKGAAVGAVTGAGAGTAAQVMTKGQRVFIPSETRLTFTLQQPLRI